MSYECLTRSYTFGHAETLATRKLNESNNIQMIWQRSHEIMLMEMFDLLKAMYGAKCHVNL